MAKRRQDDRRTARPQGIEADDGLYDWVDHGDTLMFVVGYTPGGALSGR